MNKVKITWKAEPVEIKGVKYAMQKLSSTLYNVYDLTSYKNAVERGEGEPILTGKLEKKDGKMLFTQI